MKRAPTAAGTSGGPSANRTATGIAPKKAAETSARRTASIYRARAGTSRRSVAAAAGSARAIPVEHHRAPRPPGPAQVLGEEEHTEEGRERRLQRENERRARGRRPRLHPGRDEVPEGAREDARHDERVPRRSVRRRLHVARRDGEDGEPDARHAHLENRQRPCVVAGREPLHGDDLQRLRDSVAEHEDVPEPGAARRPAQEQEPGQREHHADPDGRRHRRPEGGEGEQRRDDHVEPRDEARARHRRQLEAGGLQPVGEREKRSREDPRAPAGPRQRAQRPQGERREGGGRDREPDGEECEERVDADRLLHGDERVAPDRGDGDERQERGRGSPHRATLSGQAASTAFRSRAHTVVSIRSARSRAACSQRRRTRAENGPTTRQ